MLQFFLISDNHIKHYQYGQYRSYRTKKGRQITKMMAASLLAIFAVARWFFVVFNFLSYYLIWRPARAILRFLFYGVVVRVYSAYRSLLARLGWQGLGEGVLPFLFNYKLVHVMVVSITIFLVAANLARGSSPSTGVDWAHETIISQLIRSEFENNGDEEQLIVETFAGQATITPSEQSYLDNLSAFRPQPRISYGQEEDSGTDLPTIHGGTSFVKPDLAETKRAKRPRTEIIEYVVKPGDTISTIAQEYEVSVSTILWENNKTAFSLIRPGDKLRILPVSGVSHTVKKGETVSAIAKRYGVDENVILEANKLAEGATLAINMKLIIPGGRQYVEPVRQVKNYTGFSALRDIVSAPDAAPAASNKMNWPTAGGRITQYYSVRHYAIDIANKIGTPIYAADAGIVELAGWGSGYGNQIVIDHGGGKKTRYAHLSSFNIKVGDTVSKGQVLGGMGSTGWSTGSHLHFEVIIGGRKQNPLNYIK